MFYSRQKGFMNGNSKLPDKVPNELPNTRQKGVSLLTIALLLLLLGGALMAGIVYFRAQIPSNIASSQKGALAWADQAIIGFASIHHRLPCPAATPTGNEDCGLAKGWLPASALNLDATMYEPGLLPMKYMVYRNPAPSAGTHFSADLAAFDAASARYLPLNSFEPSAWDGDTPNDENEIRDIDPHDGRFVGRYDFDARNGLDMCETMRIAYVQQISQGPSAGYAHYSRGSTIVNVAYGIAAPGLGDASGDNDRFDGVNADNANAQMEPPDRAHSHNYNDYVFIRDLPSLMSSFGCQPIHYQVTENRTDEVASGSFSGLTGTVADTVELTGSILTNDTASELHVWYDREGIASPMLASVQSVALAVNVIEEVESQYDSVRDSAEETMTFAIVQAVLAGVGIAVSIASLIADAIGIAEAIGIAAACLGFCVNEYAAVAFYVAAAAASSIALIVNTAAMVTLIAGSIQAGRIVARMGGNSDLIGEFCDATALDSDFQNDINDQIKDAENKLKNAYEDAERKEEEAYKKLEGTEKMVDACYEGLLQADSETTPILHVMVGNPPAPQACTNPSSFTYNKCNFTSVSGKYEKFYSKSGRDVLFKGKYDAEKQLRDVEEKIGVLEKEIEKTDVSRQEVKNEIERSVEAYCATLGGHGLDPVSVNKRCNDFRQNLIDQYNEKNSDAVTERNTLSNSIPALKNNIEIAQKNIDNAVNALPSSVSNQIDKCISPNGDVIIPCNNKYYSLCSAALSAIHDRYRQSHYQECYNMNSSYDQAFCDDYNYYSLWLDYYRKKVLTDEAKKQYDDFVANKPASEGFACEAMSMDGLVLVFPVSAAEEILRKVDKRSVLQ